MAIGVTCSTTTTGQDIVPTLPAWNAGDLCVIHCGQDANSTAVWTVSAGWAIPTQHAEAPATGCIVWKVLEAGDSAPTISATVNRRKNAISVVIPPGDFNFNTSSPIDGFTTSGAWNYVNPGITGSALSLNASVAGVLALGTIFADGNTAPITPTSAGWTKLLECVNSTFQASCVANKVIVGSGPTGDCDFSLSASDQSIGAMILVAPATGGPTVLTINDLTHMHPVDAVNVSGNFLLVVPDLTHAHPVDQAAVAEVGANVELTINGLLHVHPVDSPQVDPNYLFDIDKLTHGHPVDAPALTVPATAITINDLTHMHPVDQADAGGNYTLGIGNLSHPHPTDQAPVGALEGTYTALIGETDRWSANAGVELNNTQGVDLLWHVVEIAFDGTVTSIMVDGVEVTGNAGIRALEALTIGAKMDGTNLFNGNLGELRVYSGAMTGPERLAVRNELTTKWISG